MKRLTAFIILFLVIFVDDLCGQAPNRSNTGIVSGIIKDSSGNTALIGATVAVYRARDTALLAYTLSARRGDFFIGGLPVDQSLRIIISYISYGSYEAPFIIDSMLKTLDVGLIYLSVSNDKLSDVVVTAIPPLRMNGDTLEFNADAFKLDPNAQTEDLLKVLPGVTVWADGVITVNGQEVKSIMVNGKPFFGGTIKVATQNIPKEAVEKIQVYQKFKDSTGQVKDSTTEINIRLKKGKDVGYFGKIFGGYGTNGTYAGDALINFFDSRTQLGIGLTHNNINKMARDMSHLLANTTFKGNGIGRDYQSDFTLPGKNIFTAGGVLLQHDFIPKSDNDNTDRINGEYFFNNNNLSDKNNSQTLTNVGGGKILNQQYSGEENDQKFAQSAYARYEKKVNGNDFGLNGSFSRVDSRANSMQTTGTADVNSNPLSINAINDRNQNISNQYGVNASFSHSTRNVPHRNFLSDYSIFLQSDISDAQQNRDFNSDYTSLVGTANTQRLSRLYNTHSANQANWLSLVLPNVTAGILTSGWGANFRVGFKDDLRINANKDVSVVKDMDSLTGIYKQNDYLTNSRHELIIDESPLLTLTSRYSSILSSELSFGPQYHVLHSYSQNAQQQLSRNYQAPVLVAKLNFFQTKGRKYTNQVIVTFSSTNEYPALQQLAPLVDSSNLNFIQAGNLNLKEQNVRAVESFWWHNSLKRKNPFSYELFASTRYAVNFITVNNKVDSLGRTTSFPVNANGYNSLSVGGQLRKSYQLKSGQLQLSLFPSYSVSRSPIYLNDTLYYFSNRTYTLKPVVTYEYNTLFTTNISIKYSKTTNKNAGKDNLPLINKTVQSEMSTILNCTKRFSVGANGIVVKNEFDAGNQTLYTILNAEMIYRLLKDHTVEIKFSGMDLLNQNAGLNNYGTVNSLTKSETTMLGRYFMLTLAWYPRKFGK